MQSYSLAKQPRSRVRVVALWTFCVVQLGFLSGTALADNFQWGDGTGSWSLLANWLDLNNPDGSSPPDYNALNLPSSSDTVYVGNGGTPTVTGSSSATSLTIDGGSSVSITTGSINVNGGQEIVGSSGSGTVSQSGGQNAAQGGDLLILGANAGSQGTYTLSAGTLALSSPFISTNVSYFSELVGLSGNGTFNQNGGIQTITYGSMGIGWNGGSQGAYNLNAGSLNVWGGETVGQYGSGTFTQAGGTNSISGGTTWDESELWIAYGVGSHGTYIMHGGTLITRGIRNDFGNGTLTMDGGYIYNSISPDGTFIRFGFDAGSVGHFTLTGGIVTNSAAGCSIRVGESGIGFLNIGGNAVISSKGSNSELYFGLNTGGAGTVHVYGNSSLSVWDIRTDSGTGTFTQDGGAVNVGGWLRLGINSNSISTYTLNSGNANLNLKAQIGESGAGTLTINGGTMAVTQDMNLGLNSGQGIVNLNGGSLSVSGNENVGVAGMGTFTQIGGVNTVNSKLILAANSGSSGTYNLGQGSLIVNSGVVINSGGRLTGNGTITGAITNGGTVSPGNGFGALTENGNYKQLAAGTLKVIIGGTPASSQYNQLIITGNASLNGTLNITFTNGFQPNVGDQFTILTCGSTNGSFSSVQGATAGNGVTLVPVYSGTKVVLMAIPPPSIVPLRVSLSQANVKASDSIDSPVVPVTDPNVLSTASPLGMGVAADDVTPVLFQFNGTPTNYTIQVTHNATSYNGSLANHLFVLQNNAWQQSTSLTISSANTCAYAYLSGLTWTDFSGTPANGVTLTVSVYLPGGTTPVASTNFLVGPPSVILVHGYSANSNSWSSDFLTVLGNGYPAGFVQAINYGTDNNNYFNTYGSLDDLMPALDNVLTVAESNLHANWAFTRYDVVGHSQGGVLLRMLCQNFPNRPAIVGANNFYRGRFRRVVTIGSPHNGSTLLHYLLDMLNSQNISAFIPAALQSYIQPKFDPFGPQIEEINNPHYPIDSRIKFNCIRTTVDDGQPPQPSINTPAENMLGLCQARSDLAKQSVGQMFLARGYDSIVDYDSQGGGAGTPVTTMPNSIASPANIAHAAVELAGAIELFGVFPFHGQTSDVNVAGTVWGLLNGPVSNFGSFVLPTPLPTVTENLIDSLAPKPTFAGTIVSLLSFKIPSTNYFFGLQTSPVLATNAPVTWFAQVFGTNGIVSDGILLLVNSNNTSQVEVSVTNGLVGTVVLYASYPGTNGNLVFANPIVVASYPAGTTLSRIELNPASATLLPGNELSTTIWGDYTNGGMRSQLYIPAGQVSYTSSNPKVATVSSSGTILMNAFGTAAIFAYYNGFSAQTVVTSIVPAISSISGIRNTNKTFQLSFTGTVSTTNVIEASINLVNWVPIATLYNTNGFLQFLDVTASIYPIRFYRVKITNAGSTSIQPFIWISSQTRLTNGAFQLSLTGTAGRTNIVQASTNLISWTSLQTFLNTNGTVFFVDQSATNAKQKFYRVVIPQ